MFFVAATLDISLTRRVSVSIAPLADDDAAFTALSPATAIFIADHANVLNVTLGCDGPIGGKRRSERGSDEKRACAGGQSDNETLYNISPKVIVSVGQ
jgi:hypothetical protein